MLLAMGVPIRRAVGSIRFSLGERHDRRTEIESAAHPARRGGAGARARLGLRTRRVRERSDVHSTMTLAPRLGPSVGERHRSAYSRARF